MSIISFVFFGFIALVFCCLFLIDKRIQNSERSNRLSNLVLLAASYIFILYADWRFAVVLAAVTLAAWYFAGRKRFAALGILIPLGALALFKYANFFAASFASVFGMDYTTLSMILPLGISFYVFSAIGYVIDVRRGNIEHESLCDTALYLSFFPKITSGPVQKSGDFFLQIHSPRSVGWDTFAPGIQIFMFGLFKKIVLADHLSVFVNQVYATPMAFGSLTVFAAAVAYSFQIYFDFSGYSDMAIGVARILGFKLPRNFNLPYLSHNVSEFWKRWHITLSTWLQEYLYISLGGNRKGKLRTYCNLILTMVLGGIWHGASWNYVIWGALHGVALAIHKLWMATVPSKKSSRIGSILSICLTFLFTTFCWIFFRAESLSQAIAIIRRIFSFEDGLQQPYLWLFVSILIFIGSSAAALRNGKKATLKHAKFNTSSADGFYPLVDLGTMWGLIGFFVFCGLIISFAYTGGSAFIYGSY